MAPQELDESTSQKYVSFIGIIKCNLHVQYLKVYSYLYSKGQQAESVDCDIYQYGHFEVDRIGVLLDVWANEALLLECKLNVRFI